MRMVSSPIFLSFGLRGERERERERKREIWIYLLSLVYRLSGGARCEWES